MRIFSKKLLVTVFFSVCTALLPFSESFAAEGCTLETEYLRPTGDSPSKPLSPEKSRQFLEKHDFSRLFTHVEYDEYIEGYLGDDYRRVFILMPPDARKTSPTTYQFFGEINNEPFRGEILVKEVRHIAKKYKQVKTRGYLLSELRLFKADGNAPVATGDFLTGFYISTDGDMLYDNWESMGHDNGWTNNLFSGTCTLAGQESRKCVWADGYTPCSEELNMNRNKYSSEGYLIGPEPRPMPDLREDDIIGRWQSNACGMSLTLSKDGRYELTGKKIKPMRGTYAVTGTNKGGTKGIDIELSQNVMEHLGVRINNGIAYMGHNLDLEGGDAPARFPTCQATTIRFWKTSSTR